MKGYAYILECSDGSYYTGSTSNLELRILQHQNGEGSNYTRKHLPVKLIGIMHFRLAGLGAGGNPNRISIQLHQHHLTIMLIAHSAFNIQQS